MANFLLTKIRSFVLKMVDRFSSEPDQNRVFESLNALYANCLDSMNKRGKLIEFSMDDKFILLSDQHKGAKNGSDDFAGSEANYLAALDFYSEQSFHYINLGDSEELWENNIEQVKKYNSASFQKEKEFINRNAFTKVFGNHDLFWDNSPFAKFYLSKIYGVEIPIYEGVLMKMNLTSGEFNLFLTHGHQGDAQSDGNWFSKFFVANVWGPLQNWLKINPNTPSANDHVKTAHNRIMYEWASKQSSLVLVTGHTHQPVFESLTHIERLYLRLKNAMENNQTALQKSLEMEIERRKQKGDSVPDFTSFKPCYFNTGCCCFSDGDITGIEIEGGKMRLVKWSYGKDLKSERIVLEECELELLIR